MERCRILCVDDDTDFLIGIRMYLKKVYPVTTAVSIEEGLKVLDRSPIDLILLRRFFGQAPAPTDVPAPNPISMDT